MTHKLRPSQVVIVAGGVVAFIASFLPWLRYEPLDLSRSAWSDGLLPTYTWVGIAGAVMATQVLLQTFSTVRFPARVATFTWPQIHVILGGLATLLAVSFLIAGDHFGFGFWLSLLAAIALLVGAVMLFREGDPATPPTTIAY
jgi:hypothetical protein